MTEHPFRFSMSLNILNHLGINLYSNVPAVLSEIVANSWDADAENVYIDIDSDSNTITITDDGYGMNKNDINKKYLCVGYEKRKHIDRNVKPKNKRDVMGRKGIGKLSLFSIANIVTVESVKDGNKNGFIMSAQKIRESIEKEAENSNIDNVKEYVGTYHPDPIKEENISLNHTGTRIILTELKKRLIRTVAALKVRIARRFSIIGDEYNFSVNINGIPVKITDRDYFHKVQYMLYFGDESKRYVDYCKKSNLEYNEMKNGTFHFSIDSKNNIVLEDTPTDENEYILPENITECKVTGWIATVKHSGDLREGKENINKIVIMARGKLAQEDILEEFHEKRIFSDYLIGEIHAEFLEDDDKDDIATSNRQEFIKYIPSYIALRKWIEKEIKYIGNKWTKLRNESGTEEARKISSVREWYDNLGKDYKRRATILFGKLNRIKFDKGQKKMIYRNSILAFESYRYKQNLDALENISPSNLEELTSIIADFDDIEATLYHQIIKERLTVINTLRKHIQSNVLERVVQEHLYKHLWLLDPSWDRATETPQMEQSVKKEFDNINAKLTKKEKDGRFDIKYKNTAGKHVIIELKRAGVLTNSFVLLEQVDKYRTALAKCLNAAGIDNEPIETVCIVGRELSDWTNPEEKDNSLKVFAAKKSRIILYQQLINDAYRSYSVFLDKNKSAGRVSKLIEAIEADDFQ